MKSHKTRNIVLAVSGVLVLLVLAAAIVATSVDGASGTTTPTATPGVPYFTATPLPTGTPVPTADPTIIPPTAIPPTAVPTSTPTATLAPTPAPTVTLPVPPLVRAACPTDGEMQALFGFDRPTETLKPVFTGVRSEGELCKWTLQAVEDHVFKSVPFLNDWQLTVTDVDGNVIVYYGDGVSRDIMGASFRYMPAYESTHWVWDPDRLMAHEFNYGYGQGRNPRYITFNGNLSVRLWNDYDGSYCPTNTVQISGLVGGEPAFWTPPDWSGGAWVYKTLPRDPMGPTVFHILTAAVVNDADSWIDYWSPAGAAKLIDWEAFALSEASFHCHPR